MAEPYPCAWCLGGYLELVAEEYFLLDCEVGAEEAAACVGVG